ncbi:aldo/keto reductase [bacterium]|nr:aldo/keto reductase [bacterium]
MTELSLSAKYKLNNGIRMPALGLGVYQMTDQEVEQAIKTALDIGYRHFDTAAFYKNEQAVGKVIRESGIPREEIFVTTKLWPTDYLFAEKAFERSLKNLDIDYIDLYLLHWPTPGKNRAWKSLERMYASERVGVSPVR